MKKVVAVIGVALIAIVLGSTIAVAQHIGKPHPQQPEPIYTAQQLLDQANALRAEKGVAPLKLDERMNKSAQLKADDMRNGSYYEHVSPTTGKHGYESVYVNVPECALASENLDNDEAPNTGYSPFDETYGWPASAPHYAAEIDPKYDITGFGYVEFGGKGYYVQHFCDLK
jgi:uncharacterized protein YkwD